MKVCLVPNQTLIIWPNNLYLSIFLSELLSHKVPSVWVDGPPACSFLNEVIHWAESNGHLWELYITCNLTVIDQKRFQGISSLRGKLYHPRITQILEPNQSCRKSNSNVIIRQDHDALVPVVFDGGKDHITSASSVVVCNTTIRGGHQRTNMNSYKLSDGEPPCRIVWVRNSNMITKSSSVSVTPTPKIIAFFNLLQTTGFQR